MTFGTALGAIVNPLVTVVTTLKLNVTALELNVTPPVMHESIAH